MKQQILEKWQRLAGKHNQRNARERALIVGSILLCVYLIWDFAFYQPVVKKQEALELRLSSAKSELLKLTAEEKVFSDSLAKDPAAGKRRELLRLEEALKFQDEELQALAVGLIPAKMLPQILYDVLNESEKLKFIAMNTAAAEKLQFNEGLADLQNDKEVEDLTEDDIKENVGVYKHAVRVRFEGDYFAAHQYLKNIENLQWKVYWQLLDYKVLDHPNARIELEVFTLSTDEGLLSAQL